MSLFSKKRNKLLTSGCSFTDESFKSITASHLPDKERGGWDFWPKYVAKELDLDYVNFGASGASNDYIFESITAYLHKHHDEIDVVMVLWTDYQRFSIGPSFLGKFVNPLAVFIHQKIYDLYGAKHFKQQMEDRKKNWHITDKFYGRYIEHYLSSTQEYVDRSFAYMLNLHHICNSYGIGLIQFHGLVPLPRGHLGANLNVVDELKDHMNVEWSYLKDTDCVILSELYDQLDDLDNFIGFPGFKSLGGFNSYNLIGPNVVSDKDAHPNAKGQEIIADEFIKTYKKVYKDNKK
jgi:hypothetical protein